MISSRSINLTFSEFFSKVIHQWIEKREDTEILLKTYFAAGVTPEFAENSEDADTLEGGTILFLNL